MAAGLGDAAVSGVASKVAELWFDSIKREISYVFKYQSHIDGLKKLVNELEDKKQMVEEPVKAAKLQGDEIYEAVEKWLKKVAELTETVAKLITGGEDEAKRRCFKGLCPNLFKRYNLSKESVKAAKEGADLLGRGNFTTFSYRPAGDLESQVEELKFLRQRVEIDIERAESQGENIFEDVKFWLIRLKDFDDKAVNAAEEVGNLLRKGKDFSTVSYRPAGDLERQVEELKFLRQRVEIDIERAESQGENIFEDVKFWLIRVKDFDDKAVNGAEEVGNLLRKGKDFSTVSYPPLLEQTEVVRVRGYQQFDSRLKVFHDVMEALNNSNVDMIGVYGMGGVGKTTLVKQVAKKVKEVKLFDKVIMAEVTQIPDHKKIQDEIACYLGLEFRQQEIMSLRAERLRIRLKKEKRVLIILDNIWTKLEFDAVGIPFRDDENQVKDDQRPCTIIMTSRSRDLLCNDMQSRENFPVEGLSDEEAQQLFEKIVGDSAKHSDFQHIAHDIVGRCGGLPVALNTIANALKNKTLPIWMDALDKLRNSHPREIPGMNANVYASIELSYDFLESDEAKSLFLLCGLLRACDSLYFSHLLRYGMGLGLFKDVNTLEKARNRVHMLIDNLKASCLLLDGDSEDEVKMHDIIHAVAVSIAREKLMFHNQNVADLKEETIIKGSTLIYVVHRDIQELPEKLECPQLMFLLLCAENGSSMQIPDLLFNGMEKLKVLDFTGFCFPSLPSSLGWLINLQTLCLESCQLQDIAMVGQLKKLEILSFRHSNIEQLPTEIGQLTHLRLLDLAYCNSLEVIPANVISKLSRLEELYVGDSFANWEKEKGGENSSLVELKGLSKLTTLDIHILNAEMIQQDLVSVELERFWIYVGYKLSWYDKYQTSRFMKLDGLEKTTLLGNYSMKMMLKRTEDLFLKELKGLQNVVHELDDEEGFPRLKRLHVQNCHEILHIISLVGQVHCKVFPLLESLFLSNLINLEKVCNGQLTEDQSFSNLRIIEVEECVRLKHLFSFSMAKNLLRLQKIEVSHCGDLEMIVGSNMEKPTALGEIISEEDSHVKVIFPSLEELKLVSLITMENILHNQFQGMSNSYLYKKLKKVTLENCKSLKYMFSYSMVNSLVQLEHLDISFCESMEAVLVNTTSTGLGRDEGKLIEMAFPKLNYLRLVRLPKLTSFAIAMDIHSVEFPSLLKLEIYNCPNLSRFNSMRSLNDSVLAETQSQPFLDEKVGLPNLELLTLQPMNNSRQIWHHQLAYDSLKKLEVLKIWYFKELISIFPQRVALSNLKTLSVSYCHGLRSLMTLSMAQSMAKLTSFEISQCEKMEEIIQELGDEVKDDHIVFSQLEYLQLSGLKSLKSFCLGNYTLEFSSLEQVYVWECPNMKTFSQGDLLTPKLHKVNLDYPHVEEWCWEGNLNSTIQKTFKEMVGFRGTIDLTLSLYPYLKEIWHSHKLPVNCFNELIKLEVDGCTDMSSAIPMNILCRLNNLIYLTVCNCDSIEDVFHLEELNIDEYFGPLLPKLKYLNLINLPKLQRFCNFTGNIIEFPSLSWIEIENCLNLEEFVSNSTSVHLAANKEPQEMTTEENFLIDDLPPFFDEKVAIPRLKKLKLSTMPKLLCLRKERLECNKLARSWVSFQNMTTLAVRNCDSLQEVFHLEELNIDEHFGPLLPKIRNLQLINLPKLQRFCNFTRNIIELPFLSYMQIENCPTMEAFVSNSVSVHMTANKEPQEMTSEVNFMIDDIHPFFDEKVAIPCLKELELLTMPKLLCLLKERLECSKLSRSWVTFQNITTLGVSGFEGLRSLMTLSTSESVVKLTIREMTQEVGEEVKIDIGLVFVHLKYLKLHRLPSLTSFCMGNYILEFPSSVQVIFF